MLLLVQVCFGQNQALIKIAGTHCSLLPPEGFIVSSDFSGLQQNETGASIMITEIPASYQSIVAGFTADALKTRGMHLVNKEVVDFNNAEATYYTLTQQVNGLTYHKQMLVFGDDNQTVLLNGIYPEASKGIENVIKEALFSTVFNQSQNDNPLDAAKFSVNTDDTDFKPVKYIAGSVLYSTDGKIPTQKPTLIVGNSIAKVSVSNRKEYAEKRMKGLPDGKLFDIKQVNEITIDDLNGYEIIATLDEQHTSPSLIYQVMLFDHKDEYFIIVGQTQENHEHYLAAFKKVAKTFKRK